MDCWSAGRGARRSTLGWSRPGAFPGLDRRRHAGLPLPPSHRGVRNHSDQRLTLETTVIPTGRRRVPIAFGWHPYLQLPGTPRRRWQLRLPAADPPRPRRAGHPDGRRASREGRSRPDRRSHVRRSLRARQGPPPHPRVRRRVDLDALRCGIPLCPGVGACRSAVRGSRADGRSYEQLGRWNRATSRTGCRLHRRVHPRRRGTTVTGDRYAERRTHASPVGDRSGRTGHQRRDVDSGEVEAVEVHDLVPRGHEVAHELLLRVVATRRPRRAPGAASSSRRRGRRRWPST